MFDTEDDYTEKRIHEEMMDKIRERKEREIEKNRIHREKNFERDLERHIDNEMDREERQKEAEQERQQQQDDFGDGDDSNWWS